MLTTRQMVRVLAALRLADEAIRRGQVKGAKTALRFLDIAMEKLPDPAPSLHEKGALP